MLSAPTTEKPDVSIPEPPVIEIERRTPQPAPEISGTSSRLEGAWDEHEIAATKTNE